MTIPVRATRPASSRRTAPGPARLSGLRGRTAADPGDPVEEPDAGIGREGGTQAAGHGTPICTEPWGRPGPAGTGPCAPARAAPRTNIQQPPQGPGSFRRAGGGAAAVPALPRDRATPGSPPVTGDPPRLAQSLERVIGLVENMPEENQVEGSLPERQLLEHRPAELDSRNGGAGLPQQFLVRVDALSPEAPAPRKPPQRSRFPFPRPKRCGSRAPSRLSRITSGTWSKASRSAERSRSAAPWKRFSCRSPGPAHISAATR